MSIRNSTKNIKSSMGLIICHRAFIPGKFSIERVFDSFLRFLPLNLNYSIIKVPRCGASLSAILHNLYFCWKLPSNMIVHISGDIHYVIPILRGKKILTVHDCASILKSNSKFVTWLKRLLWFRLPLKFADIVTCISESTYHELISLSPAEKRKIRIIPNPINDDFRWAPKAKISNPPTVLHFVKYANKNTLRVVLALQGIDCHLRLVGYLNPDVEKELKKVSYSWSSINNLSEKQLIDEYRKCDIVCFPSLYEGFGMPIIEAQAIGRVVLTSQREPMIGIAGRGALLVDPEDTQAIHDGILRLIQDPNLCDRLIEQGQKNVRRFLPKMIARQYHTIYQQLLSTKK